jgi:putative transposase
MTEAEVASIRHSIRRGRPFGSETWTRETAERLGLEFSLRPPKGERGETAFPQIT